MTTSIGADVTKTVHMAIEPFQIVISEQAAIPHDLMRCGVRQFSPKQDGDAKPPSSADDLPLEPVHITVDHDPIETPFSQDAPSVGNRDTRRPGEVSRSVKKRMIVTFKQWHVPSDRHFETGILPATDTLIAEEMDANRQAGLGGQAAPQGRKILDRMADKNAQSLAHRWCPLPRICCADDMNS